MKRSFSLILLTIIVLSVCNSAFAQHWEWGKRAQNKVVQIAVDNNDNTYVLWAIADQANIDGHAIPCNGYSDIAVTSFKCDGSYRWTKVVGSSSPDAGFGLGTDTLGGLYILGYLGSSGVADVYVDADTVIAPTSRRMVLFKYDTSGNYQWLRMPEPTTTSGVTANAGFNITVTPGGDVHIMSVLTPDSYAGGAFAATYPGDNNIYALKYDKNGNFIGGLHFDVTRPANAGIAPYSFNLIYDPASTHYYWAGMRYDPNTISFGNTAITGGNFLTCFNSNGSVAWVQKSNNDAIPTALVGKPAIDEAGNVYVAGYSYNDFNGGTGDGFGSYDFDNTLGVWAFPVLVKFSSTGNVMYAKNASDNMDNAGTAVAYHNGMVALTGHQAGGNFLWDGVSIGPNNEYYDVFLARFDATTGTCLAIDTIPSGTMVNEYPTHLVSDRKGNFYVGGEFDGNMTVAGTTLTKQDGYTDGFIARFEYHSCDCILPATIFSYSGAGSDYTMTYIGSMPVDSVIWSFGDGHTGTGITATHTYTVADTFTICATAYNECGSNQYCQTVISIIANTQSVSGLSEAFPGVCVYPNPAEDKLQVKGLASEISYRLYNSIGGVVMKGGLSSWSNTINISELAGGYYVLCLYDEFGNKGQMKVVKR
jgi:hypothetical protein